MMNRWGLTRTRLCWRMFRSVADQLYLLSGITTPTCASPSSLICRDPGHYSQNTNLGISTPLDSARNTPNRQRNLFEEEVHKGIRLRCDDGNEFPLSGWK